MPKAGSGFKKAAYHAAASIARTGGGSAGDWRMGDIGEFADIVSGEMARLYRSGIRITRTASGDIKNVAIKPERLAQAREAINTSLKNLQVRDPEAQERYDRLRETWSSPTRTNAEEMREVRKGIRDTMLINPRGGRRASDAQTKALQSGWDTGSMSNQEILIKANEMMNAERSQIWKSLGVAQSAGYGRTNEEYSADIFGNVLEAYKGVERGAWRRRKNK